MITESSFHLIKPADFVKMMRWYDNHEMVVKTNGVYKTSGKPTITSANAPITTFTNASAASAATSPSTSFTSPSILISPHSTSITSPAISSVPSPLAPSIFLVSHHPSESASELSISGSSFGAIQGYSSYSAKDELTSVSSWDDCRDINNANNSQDIPYEGGNYIPTAPDTIIDQISQRLQNAENETLHVGRHENGTDSNERHRVVSGGLESAEIRFGCDVSASSQHYTAEKFYMDSVAVDISGEWEVERNRSSNKDGNLMGGGPCPTIEPPTGEEEFYALEEFTGYETEDEEAEEMVHQMQLRGDQFWEDRKEEDGEDGEEEIEYWKVFGGQAGEVGHIDAEGHEVAGKWAWEKGGKGVYTWGGRDWLGEWNAVFNS